MNFQELSRTLPSSSQRADLWRLLKLAGKDFIRDDGPSWAAAIAYYSLLSLFPLLLALGSIAAFFVDAEWAVQQATRYLGAFLPRGPVAIEQVVAQTLSKARGGALLSILPLLWTGSLVFGAITKGLNLIFESQEDFRFWRRLLMRLMMLLSLGVMFLIALGSPLVLQAMRWIFGILPFGQENLYQLVLYAVPPIFMLASFFLAFRFVPRRRPRWRAALGGAAVAALLFAAAKPLFLGYLQWLARYNVIYGSLAGIIVVVLWTWIVAMIGLFGGQVAAHAHAVFFENKSLDEVERHDSRDDPPPGENA